MNKTGFAKDSIIVAISAITIGTATSPIAVPIMQAACTHRPLDSSALAMLFFTDGGWHAYLSTIISIATKSATVAYFAAWIAIVAAAFVLYVLYSRAAKPKRIADNDSPLGSASIIKSPAELRRKNDFWNGKGVPEHAGLVLGCCRKGYFYDHSIPHYLCVAKTGAGKSQTMVIPSLHLGMAAGVNLLVTGKSELVELTGEKAREVGYRQIIIDVTGYPGASRFNPIDLVAEYAENGMRGEAQKTARQIAADLIPLGGEANTYFPKSARACLTATILAVAFSDADRERKNMASVADMISIGTTGPGRDPSAPLKDYILGLGPNHPAFGPAGDFLSDGGLTTAGKNVVSTLKESLTIFNDDDIRRSTATSTVSITDLFREKSVVYCHLPEEGDPYQVIYAAFFNQWWRVAQAEAKRNGGRLPRKTIILGDEWGNMGRVECTGQMVTLGRSMGLSANLFVQNLKQLNAYNTSGDNGAGKAKILGSIGGKVALSLSDNEDAEEFSKSVGKRTVRTQSISEQHQNGAKHGTGQNLSETADDVIHPWEWKNRVAIRDGGIVVKGGENAAPGHEGVFEMPLAYANKTPAGLFFGLGTEEQEHRKRATFFATAQACDCGREEEVLTWLPNFNAATAENMKAEVLDDEFSAWD